MKGSLKLGTAFGIPLYLHWSFLVLAFFLIGADTSNLLWLPVLCLCVLLHELGHSVTARHFGVRVLDITLLPIGGMARMAAMPEQPRIEGLVAIAGPAVNFVLALFGAVGIALGTMLTSSLLVTASVVFTYLNLVLGVFNLLPAFPMDGGRVLRAFLARRSNWVAATEGAVRVGRWIAGSMALTPFLLPLIFPSMGGGFSTLPFIALFVWFAGGRELIGVRLSHGLPPLKSMELAGANAVRPPFAAQQPTNVHVRSTAPSHGNDESAEPGKARRPLVWDEGGEGPAGMAQRGFDPHDIRALEHFRGRLRRFPPEGKES